MAGSGGAGRSAEDWSRQLRQQAARLEARAARIEQGARGERRTAGVLNPRSGDGWYVLHDLAVPDSRANIDHVVVTPAGVFVVDVQALDGPDLRRQGHHLGPPPPEDQGTRHPHMGGVGRGRRPLGGPARTGASRCGP